MHHGWEDPAEWMACDDQLHRQGCKLIAPGVIVDADDNVIGVLDEYRCGR